MLYFEVTITYPFNTGYAHYPCVTDMHINNDKLRLVDTFRHVTSIPLDTVENIDLTIVNEKEINS